MWALRYEVQLARFGIWEGHVLVVRLATKDIMLSISLYSCFVDEDGRYCDRSPILVCWLHAPLVQSTNPTMKEMNVKMSTQGTRLPGYCLSSSLSNC